VRQSSAIPSSPSLPATIEPLTEREQNVLRLIAQGFSNRWIAQELVISPNTVRIHASRIYNKLDVHSRTEAVAVGRKLGLLPPA
jgi:LuxR family maltose regulon positive regulatory protein